MVIAVISMTVMQPSMDQIIEVIAVRNQWMPAPIVPALACDRRAPRRIFGAHGNHMLVIVILVWMMEVSIVEIVYVSIVKNTQMPAMLAVNVGMRIVDGMGHRKPPFLE